MKTAMDRLSLALACLLAIAGPGALSAQEIKPPPKLTKPKPLPPIGQNTIPDPNATTTTPSTTTPTATAPTFKPWAPPVYPSGVRSKPLNPTEKLGGELASSVSLRNEPPGYKLHSSLSVPEGLVMDLATGAKLFCLPQVGEKETRISVDGWITTHGSNSQPCYIGAYTGRVSWQIAGGAVRAQYCVFKSIDFSNRGGLMDFSNCLFIDCTLKVDGSAGGQIDMNNCSMQEGSGKTALTIVRSARGPIARVKGVKFDDFQTGLAVDAYDATLARTTLWEAKELQFTNISGKAIVDSDPIRVDFGRLFIMGEKDTKAAIEKWVEYKTPGSKMKGTPAVNIAGLSPTELTQVGTNIKVPNLEEEAKPEPGKEPKKPVVDLGDDG